MSTLINGFSQKSKINVHWKYNGSKNPQSSVLQSGAEDISIPDLEKKGDYWTFKAKKDDGNNEQTSLKLNGFIPHHNIEIKYNKNTHIWKITAGAQIPAGECMKAGGKQTGGFTLPTQTNVNVEIGPK